MSTNLVTTKIRFVNASLDSDLNKKFNKTLRKTCEFLIAYL